MPIPVRFTYHTGLERSLWFNPRLSGSWNGWTPQPMAIVTASDGCPAFAATVDLEPGTHQWGVFVDSPARNNIWAIMDEVGVDSGERHRTFVLRAGDAGREESYFFTHCRRLGAQKDFRGGTAPAIRFAVWAPNATSVEVVFGDSSGYIAADGRGIDPALPSIPLARGGDGVWENDPAGAPSFASLENRPYMYRITRGNGDVRYRTDIYSRSQIGRGRVDPAHQPYSGDVATLDGTKSCSVVIDPDLVGGRPAAEFWLEEMSHEHPLPQRVEDLVIYELLVNVLGFDHAGPGTFADAIDPRFLDHLQDLGVNALELMPVQEFQGDLGFGYGTSHFFALESSAGGRDALKRLVRACHQRGIAVILDVVYNHYHHDSERAQWMYDDESHERNIYFWYVGKPSDYPFERGGYVWNNSSADAPRYYEEMVRKLFVSSAVTLIEEFHIDGLRVDQTTSIRSYNALELHHGIPVPDANTWGAKLLRQLTRTLKLVKPSALLIAEDHDEGEKERELTRPTAEGGLGFDAAWYAGFYHNLVGDAHHRSEARLLKFAGMGGDEPLRMDWFAGALGWSGEKKIVYGESHDEAGNSGGTSRTIVTAVNGAALTGATRRYAEARSRFAFSMAALSAGTPMLFAGDEIGATKPVLWDQLAQAKEDLFGERRGAGAHLFAFYSDIIKLRLRQPVLRSRAIRIVHVSNEERVLAFTRGNDEYLVIGTLSNQPLTARIGLTGQWQEIFNTDSMFYGGDNVGNEGRVVTPVSGVIVPANGVVVFRRV